MRWVNNGKVIRDDHVLVSSGGEMHANRVGIVVTKGIAKSIIG